MGNICCFPTYRILREGEQIVEHGCFRDVVRNGPGCFCIPPFTSTKRRRPHLLDETQYVKVRNEIDGSLFVIKGPQLYFPGAYDTVTETLKIISLSKNEFVKIKNTLTGEIRVERGECQVLLGPTEVDLQKRAGWAIDEHHAVIVRDLATSELTLVTKEGLFIPGPYEEVVNEQKKIVLQDFEVCVVVNPRGEFEYRRGDDPKQRTFFIPPFHELLELTWSNPVIVSRVAQVKARPDPFRQVSKFDLRPSFMNYEFIARTVDNVELAVAVTFFWRIIDVQAMLQKSADTPGDICTHARSVIIQAVANHKLLDFLTAFNDIVVRHIMDPKDAFYVERGAEIMNVEVMKFSCVDENTNKVLQEIIQETTERLKALEKQRSENEVALARVEGHIMEETTRAKLEMVKIQAQIEQEKENATLIDLKKDHERRQQKIEGEAEASKVLAFLGTLGDATNFQQKLDLYYMLRKLDAIQAVSNGNASLYYTPNDVNLSIESFSHRQAVLPSNKN